MYGGQSFGTCNSKFFGKYKNLYVTVPFLLCFITSYLRAISKYKPPGAYILRAI